MAEILDSLENEPIPVLDDLYQRIWSALPSTAKRVASQTAQVILARVDTIQNWSGTGESALRLVDLALALGHPEETITSPILRWPHTGS